MTSRFSNSIGNSPETDFETALQALILESFASGERVRGNWEITPESAVVPNWRVTIEKLTDAECPNESATFVDE